MAEVAASFSADISQFKQAMAQMSQATAQMEQSVSKGTQSVAQTSSKATSSFSDTMNKVGTTLTVAGAATTAFGVKSLKSFGSFQASLNQAAVVAGGTSKDISGLADVANRLGADLPLSAQDAADAMVSMARDGASISDIKKEFPAIGEAATAAGSDLQATASVVQQAMNIWGDSIGTPAQAAQDLVATANLSNASVESMQQALATIGPTANNAGYSMQDMSTALGLLTNQGQSSAQASQDLNHAILALMAPSKVTAGELKGLGVSVTDSAGKMKPFPQLLGEISSAMDGMTDKEKTASLKRLVGTAGLQALGPLLKSVADQSGSTKTSWAAFNKELERTTSTSEAAQKALKEQASEMQKNVGSKIEQVGGNWEALSNKSMEAKGGVSSAVLDMMNNTLTWASESNSSVAKVARGFIGLSPVLGPVLTAVGGTMKGLSGLASGIGAIGKAGAAIAKGTTGLIARIFGIGTASESAGAKSKTSAKQMASMGKATMEIGIGVGIAVAGIALLVLATTQLAKQGNKGAIAAVAVAAGIATISAVVIIGIKTLGKLGQTAGGTVKILNGLGNNAIKVGGAIAIASVGVAVLVASISLLAKQGTNGVIALAAVTVAVIAMGVAFKLLGPSLTANAIGIGVFGAAVLAIGAGVGIASAGIGTMINAFNNLTSSVSAIIPTFTAIGTGFVAMITIILTGIVTNAPLITQAMIAIGTSILTTINTLTPQVATTVAGGLLTVLTTIGTYTPQYVAVILQTLVDILNTLASYVVPIASAVTNILVAIFTAIGENAPRITAAFFAMIGQLAQAVVQQAPYIEALFTAFLAALVASGISYGSAFLKVGGVLMKALWAGITGKKFDIGSATADVMKGAADNAAKAGSTAFDSMGGNSAIKALQGISKKNSAAKTAGTNLMNSAKAGISSKATDIKNAGISLGSNAVSGLDSKKGAARNSGSYFGQGFNNGLESQRGNINSTAASIADSASQTIQSHLKIHSPSRVTYSFGAYFGEGFVNGMSSMIGQVSKTAGAMSSAAVLDTPTMDKFTNGLDTTQMSANISSRFSADDMAQSVDTKDRVQPIFVVNNELVGDKIRTIVKQGDKEYATTQQYFR